MPETNSPSGGGILIAAVVLWTAFVLIYPSWWTPSAVPLSGLPRDRNAVPLKLPDVGPLRLMLGRGARVILNYQPSVEGQSPGRTVEAVESTAIMPASTSRIENVRVLDVTCLGIKRQPPCWAILSLPHEEADALMRAGSIWVLVQGGMEPSQKSGTGAQHD